MIARLYSLSILLLFFVACNTTSKMKSGEDAGKQKQEHKTEYVSDIVLHNKPLATIQKHVANRKWQLLYRVGGLTGKELARFDNTYITITDSEVIREEDGEEKHHKIKWEPQRDITTGDSTYVITGFVNWKVEGIYNDTLRLADNYYDGYGYALVPAEK